MRPDIGVVIKSSQVIPNYSQVWEPVSAGLALFKGPSRDWQPLQLLEAFWKCRNLRHTQTYWIRISGDWETGPWDTRKGSLLSFLVNSWWMGKMLQPYGASLKPLCRALTSGAGLAMANDANIKVFWLLVSWLICFLKAMTYFIFLEMKSPWKWSVGVPSSFPLLFPLMLKIRRHILKGSAGFHSIFVTHRHPLSSLKILRRREKGKHLKGMVEPRMLLQTPSSVSQVWC